MSVRKFISFCIVLCIFLGKATLALAQVNLQTGSAVFSIPMFSWQDDYSRLSSTVALSYNSGAGLKVDDVASDVGEGWSLVAGGVITRLQVGLPDDQQAFIGTNPSTQVVNGVSTQVENDQDISKYPAGYQYETVSPNNGCPNVLTKYPIYKGMNQLYTQHNVIAEDRQEDYFSFSFNGKSGVFVINTYNGTMTPQTLDDSKMILSVQANPAGQQANNIRTAITSFTIQDVNGLIYTFSQLGITQVLHDCRRSACPASRK
jgi:hypothetical protein